jgi:HK97 family phage portal protein
MKLMDWIREKLNPAQYQIAIDEGSNLGSTATNSYLTAFNTLETVNRGTSMIVSGCASLDYDVKDKKTDGVVSGVRQKTLFNLLNFTPNPYQSAQDFRVNIFTDFILEGNIFLYYDGVYLYHLPAVQMEIETDSKTYVKQYNYNKTIIFKPDEIIHVKDLSSTSIYRGQSRLSAAARNIDILQKMQNYQGQFFDNGAVSTLVFTTDNTLSDTAKDKTVARWLAKYNPKNGAKKPMILDSGLKPYGSLTDSFQEMDFDTSIGTHDRKILKALGVPPILLDGGNNANISPNLRLFYLETVLPIVTKFVSSIERYFGYDVLPITANVSALQPELKDMAHFYTTLVNTGILTPNEAREELRYAPIEGQDEIRVPANIAGSAANPSVGGAPPTKA